MISEKIVLIKETMERIAVLLDLGGYVDWSASIRDLAEQYEYEPNAASHALLRLYGGMGSLNDLIIHDDGNILISENEELDKLRTELFNLVFYD